MMKAKLERCLLWLREGFTQMLRLHPVEAALIVVGSIGCLLAYELDWDDAFPKLAVVPLAFAAALVVNNLAGRGPWRRVYWVCWAPFVPLVFWSGLEDWLSTGPSLITYGILVPLALLLCRRAVENVRFVGDVMIWLRSGILAAFFANVALGLFCAILYSTTYIFGLDGVWIEHVSVYAVIFFETFAAPVLFLMMYDRWSGGECTGSRILEVLLNYIVAPALLIYTAILYLYMAKILVTWSLPEGGVAYLVFGFTLFALAVQALQPLLQKRMYDWFFDRFSLISLPTQVLFWIGVLRRTGEYGLTEPRVYLLVSGGLMTLCVVLFLARRTGRYFYVGVAGFLCFAALAYIPALCPERVAVDSQVRRAVRVAKQLEMLDADGRLKLDSFVADSLLAADYRRMYEALDYVADHDTTAFARFGVKMKDVRGAVPQVCRDYVVYGLNYVCDTDSGGWISVYNDRSRCVEIPSGYRRLYMNVTRYGDDGVTYRFRDDSLRIDFRGERPAFVISGQELLQRQLLRVGQGAFPATSVLEAASDKLLTYSDDDLTILFSNMSMQRRDSTLWLDDVTLDAVMSR
ncbi:DUF4153 domain-containing protein [uncultured Alistipes sp.]|jgi:hypothetical protein|uniref:DUF4153 domain-containing protein n=2 Tax=uncultured Alistipes sp. TaxID=538949 RepID=UPI0025E1F502|nr:DUF4153 domain-containing protein [uncultured Alistipes sp.]